MRKKNYKIAFIFGTRPEAIKLAPIILALRKIKKIRAFLISTGQHDELLKEALGAFGLKADRDCKIMKSGQSLTYITSKAIAKLDELLVELKPDVSVVEGDTTSAMTGALVSFYHKIPIVHVEAGCRTQNIYQPFPEEINRRLIASLASWHFPATKKTKKNLIREGYSERQIFLVGSTEADALEWILSNTSSQKLYDIVPHINTMEHVVVITTHRRENWGEPLAEVFSALKTIIKLYPRIHFIYSIHPNPLVIQPARKTLSNLKNLIILPHIETSAFFHLVGKASLILTDSGGVQLQAGILGKPVLILRDLTEWPELIEKGIGRLVGTKKIVIIDAFKDYMSKKWPNKILEEPIYRVGAAEKIARVIYSQIL